MASTFRAFAAVTIFRTDGLEVSLSTTLSIVCSAESIQRFFSISSSL
jgi:hypothetical protein